MNKASVRTIDFSHDLSSVLYPCKTGIQHHKIGHLHIAASVLVVSKRRVQVGVPSRFLFLMVSLFSLVGEHDLTLFNPYQVFD